LNENANDSTVLDLTILNDDFIVWLSTGEDGTSSKVHECTVRDVEICLDSDHCSIMVRFVSLKYTSVQVEQCVGHADNAAYL